jgi:hypothetical protein
MMDPPSQHLKHSAEHPCRSPAMLAQNQRRSSIFTKRIAAGVNPILLTPSLIHDRMLP